MMETNPVINIIQRRIRIVNQGEITIMIQVIVKIKIVIKIMIKIRMAMMEIMMVTVTHITQLGEEAREGHLGDQEEMMALVEARPLPQAPGRSHGNEDRGRERRRNGPDAIEGGGHPVNLAVHPHPLPHQPRGVQVLQDDTS